MLYCLHNIHVFILFLLLRHLKSSLLPSNSVAVLVSELYFKLVPSFGSRKIYTEMHDLKLPPYKAKWQL